MILSDDSLRLISEVSHSPPDSSILLETIDIEIMKPLKAQQQRSSHLDMFRKVKNTERGTSLTNLLRSFSIYYHLCAWWLTLDSNRSLTNWWRTSRSSRSRCDQWSVSDSCCICFQINSPPYISASFRRTEWVWDPVFPTSWSDCEARIHIWKWRQNSLNKTIPANKNIFKEVFPNIPIKLWSCYFWMFFKRWKHQVFKNVFLAMSIRFLKWLNCPSDESNDSFSLRF